MPSISDACFFPISVSTRQCSVCVNVQEQIDELVENKILEALCGTEASVQVNVRRLCKQCMPHAC